MYQEQKKSINWKSVLLKIAFLIIVLILVIILLPINKIKTSKVKSDLFIENLEVLKKTANSYYKAEDLPLTKEEDMKISLGELVRSNQIRTLRDKDGNACDGDKSFINIIKNKEKYKIEVKLVCDKEIEIIYLDKSSDDFENKITTTTKKPTTKIQASTTRATTISTPQNITTIPTKIETSKVEVTTTISSMRTVTFVTNSPSKVISVSVLNGTIVERPVDPVKIGYEFVGWYKDGKLFDFNTKIYDNTFIYASWKQAN